MYPSSTRQWTIRQTPWAAIFAVPVFLGAVALIAIAENPWGAAFLPLVLSVILLLIAEIATCTLDLDTRTITMRRKAILRGFERRFSFDDLHTIAVQSNTSSSDDGGTTYRIVFVLNNGDTLPLSRASTSGRSGKIKEAHRIGAFIQQGRAAPVNIAEDGIVRIQRRGTTDGLGWEIEFIANNDRSTLTRWHVSNPGYPGRFLLLVPAAGAKVGKLPGGVWGFAVRMMYNMYLQVFDMQAEDLPGYENGEILSPEQSGLGGLYSVLTGSAAHAKNWLSPQRVRLLTDWHARNPLKAAKAVQDAHILITAEHFWMVLRGTFNQDAQVEEIARLGTALLKEQ